jgi:hypothetical protein
MTQELIDRLKEVNDVLDASHDRTITTFKTQLALCNMALGTAASRLRYLGDDDIYNLTALIALNSKIIQGDY